MVEVVGDVIMPSALVVPVISSTGQTVPTLSGSMWVSGAKLYYVDETGTEKEL